MNCKVCGSKMMYIKEFYELIGKICSTQCLQLLEGKDSNVIMVKNENINL